MATRAHKLIKYLGKVPSRNRDASAPAKYRVDGGLCRVID